MYNVHRGVETLSQLPDILTYFHLSSPAPHILYFTCTCIYIVHVHVSLHVDTPPQGCWGSREIQKTATNPQPPSSLTSICSHIKYNDNVVGKESSLIQSMKNEETQNSNEKLVRTLHSCTCN